MTIVDYYKYTVLEAHYNTQNVPPIHFLADSDK